MNRRKSPLCLLAACAALSSSAAASAENAGVWYAGLGAGHSSIDIGGSEIDAAYSGGTIATSVDDNDTAWKIFGGRRMMENLSVEVAYMDYGTLDADSSLNPAFGLGAGAIYTGLDTTAWMIDAVGILPVRENLELFGRLGVAFWNTDTNISTPAGITVLDDPFNKDGNDIHFGVGARYALNGNLGIRAEWERINADDALDAWTVGAQYNF